MPENQVHNESQEMKDETINLNLSEQDPRVENNQKIDEVVENEKVPTNDDTHS